ncbi:hypothetical protein BDY21DRAFT_357579 [Lineolata rhizophorae]|uniref:Uncharacterized protein n=1 Tax=Lineolata rhizophorae TaxID=578093 RepID=A0A6A6NNV4_9PEZI|nr:hypothetical protein BDY21DRAFT_357579 [Lineolata rhizophorae]
MGNERASIRSGNGAAGTQQRTTTTAPAAGPPPPHPAPTAPPAPAIPAMGIVPEKKSGQPDAPPKLVDVTCVICMDNPTDLTATSCGKFAIPPAPNSLPPLFARTPLKLISPR